MRYWWKKNLFKIGFPVLSALVGLLLWQIFTSLSDIPSFIFPKPSEVWHRLLSVIKDGSLLFHTLVTLQEVILGLALGLSAAIITGYFLAKSRLVEQVLAPYRCQPVHSNCGYRPAAG
ncbi:MAG: hypothetical protein P8Y37_10780, partial [Anaerolineales bacterium]